MLRIDGEIKPLTDRPVLTAADTERILWPIAPERNREEFERRNDTDFAYEIAGLARFRCNFFLDRKGMGGVFRVDPHQDPHRRGDGPVQGDPASSATCPRGSCS